MTLIAYGEIRFLNGESSLFVRFAGEEGSSFDLPVSPEQFQVLLEGVGALQQQSTEPTKPTPLAKKNYMEDDDEDEEVEDSAPFSVASRYADDDL
jgi:hypothetical protein